MRKCSVGRLIAVSGLIALGLTSVAEVRAQPARPTTIDFWGGRSNGPNASCPQLEWAVVPIVRNAAGEANGPVNGVAYYSDMSGISTVKGMITPDGKVTATLTSVSGSGPAGPVTGQRGPNGTHIELHGSGCAVASFNLPRWQATQAAGD